MASTRKYLRRNNATGLVLLASLTVIVFVVFFLMQQKGIDYVEVRDYQGQSLSSINSIQDNAIAGTQHIDVRNYTLVVDGLVLSPKNYTYDEVISHQRYQKVITLYCVEGWNANILWEGILLRDLFNETGIDSKAKIAIFHSQDGYTTSLPLDYIENRSIMLAYKMNGVVIPPEKGFPFQVVAESKYGYKWAKWITEIELSGNDNYEGFWESRGYSNTADLSG
jgi:DMSO/TMAO reductase YedYZ molybdopterin-dependent catalytic subunit